MGNERMLKHNPLEQITGLLKPDDWILSLS
jgi:hypothetical protein